MRKLLLPQFEVAKAKKRFKSNEVPDNVWSNPNIIAEAKLDGHRFKLHILRNENRLDSRRKSTVTGEYVERTDAAPHIRDLQLSSLAYSVLDGELVAGKNSNDVSHTLGSLASKEERDNIRYVVFDILFCKNKDVRSLSDIERRRILENLFREECLISQNIISLIARPFQTPDDKKNLLKSEMSAGREGIMLKDIRATYGSGWIKIKREAMIDVIFLGVMPAKQMSKKKNDSEETITKYASLNWIGSIRFGQYVNGKLIEVGQCSGMDDNIRAMISVSPEKFVGRVFTISVQERSEHKKFRHPRFKCFREADKDPTECIYEEDEC